jgi:hypothetical protein
MSTTTGPFDTEHGERRTGLALCRPNQFFPRHPFIRPLRRQHRTARRVALTGSTAYGQSPNGARSGAGICACPVGVRLTFRGVYCRLLSLSVPGSSDGRRELPCTAARSLTSAPRTEAQAAPLPVAEAAATGTVVLAPTPAAKRCSIQHYLRVTSLAYRLQSRPKLRT